MRGFLSQEMASEIVGSLLWLEAENPSEDIFFYINNTGGEVSAALTIYDTFEQINCDICTVCVGATETMGALLLSSGAKPKRFALPNARIKIEQISSNIEGRASEIELRAKELARQRETINKILAENTNRSVELIEYDMQRDFFLSASEARAYGLIDDIIRKAPPPI